jgi:hypothetical protein
VTDWPTNRRERRERKEIKTKILTRIARIARIFGKKQKMKDKNDIEIEVGCRVSWMAEGAADKSFGCVVMTFDGTCVLVAVDGGTFEHIPNSYRPIILCEAAELAVLEG